MAATLSQQGRDNEVDVMRDSKAKILTQGIMRPPFLEFFADLQQASNDQMHNMLKEKICSLCDELASERQEKRKLHQQLISQELELNEALGENELLEDLLRHIIQKVQWCHSECYADDDSCAKQQKISQLLSDILKQCQMAYPASDSESAT